MVAKKFGLDTKEFDFGSVSKVYEGLESQDITNNLSNLQSIHKPISERVNKNIYHLEQKKKLTER